MKGLPETYGTIGPSCASEDILRQIFAEGITGMRLNLSHASLPESEPWIEAFHSAAAKEGVSPSLLIDMQGPELRVGKLAAPISLREGDEVTLVSDLESSGNGLLIPVPPALIRDLKPETTLLMDDGKISLRTVCGQERLNMPAMRAVVTVGGVLKSRKSIAAKGLSVQGDTLTAQDIMNLRCAPSMGVTEIMQPFVRGADDLIRVRKAMREQGAGDLRLFAKIENRAGAQALEEIIPQADMIVIARGDLGNSLPLFRLPVLEDMIAAACRRAHKPFMVVTQMLASMEHSPVPTRAEVSDIYRAVAEGASAVMITGETAGGEYPVQAAAFLVRTAAEAYTYLQGKGPGSIEELFEKGREL